MKIKINDNCWYKTRNYSIIQQIKHVISTLTKYSVHTGQNYDYTLNQVFFEDLELREPDYYLEAVGNHLVKRWETF